MKVAYIPEHFSTPLFFALENGWLDLLIELIPVKEGLGRLIAMLNGKEVDYAIGLTEAFVADIANSSALEYNIVGTYVDSPLCWAVSTGSDRSDVTDIGKLQGKKIGVSRIGSGLYVMSFVLALEQKFSQPFFEDHVVLSNFANLRDSVNRKDGTPESDAFMWEYFTLKRYYDSGEIKQVGEIYTPWPSWVVCARQDVVAKDQPSVAAFLNGLRKGIDYFVKNPEKAVEHISTNLDYTADDAREWLKTVRFNHGLGEKSIDWDRTVAKTQNVLRMAGVLKEADDSLVDSRLRAAIIDVTST